MDSLTKFQILSLTITMKTIFLSLDIDFIATTLQFHICSFLRLIFSSTELQHFIINMLHFSSTELKLTMTVDLIANESNSKLHDIEDLTICLCFLP